MLKKAADKKKNITQIYALCHMYWFPIMTKGILGLFTLVFVFERSFILSRSRKLFEEI